MHQNTSPSPGPQVSTSTQLLNGQRANATHIPLKPVTSYKGEPSVIFSDAEIAAMAAPLRYTLVGKFSHGKPLLNDIRIAIETFGFKGKHTTGLIDSKHILIRFSDEADFHRVWIKEVWNVRGYPMRVFEWTPDF